MKKTINLSAAQSLFAQDRESITEAYPGDVIGIHNPGVPPPLVSTCACCALFCDATVTVCQGSLPSATPSTREILGSLILGYLLSRRRSSPTFEIRILPLTKSFRRFILLLTHAYLRECGFDCKFVYASHMRYGCASGTVQCEVLIRLVVLMCLYVYVMEMLNDVSPYIPIQ